MSLKKLKTNLAANIAEAIDVLEALEQKGDKISNKVEKFANKAGSRIKETALDFNDEVHEYEEPVDNVLKEAVASPHTVWLTIAALAASMTAGAFLYSLFC